MADGEIGALIGKCEEATKRGERETLAQLADRLTAKIEKSGHAGPSAGFLPLLQNLRKFRLFDQLARLAGTLSIIEPADFDAQAPESQATLTPEQIATSLPKFKVRKLQAQGLIDANQIPAAIPVLEKLASDAARLVTAAPADEELKKKVAKEHSDILGVLGRAYKQLFVNMDCGGPSPACTRNLQLAVDRYIQSYAAAPEGSRYYPAVNVLALVDRAKRNGIALKDAPEPNDVANAVIEDAKPLIEGPEGHWAAASLAETYLYQGHFKQAAEMYHRYIFHDDIDAFALASTVRQLEQIWQYKAGTKGCGPILLALKGQLLHLPGGTVDFSKDERDAITGQDLAAFGNLPQQVLTAANERRLLEDGRVIPWSRELLQVMLCGESVCRIVHERSAAGGPADGTGFLIDGEDLCEQLRGHRFVLTNSHVVSKQRLNQLVTFASALHPNSARIVFDSRSTGPSRIPPLKCDVVWESPQDELDAALLALEADPASIKALPLAPRDQQLYAELQVNAGGSPNEIIVIGHMLGGELSVSYETNRRGCLVDIGNKPPPGERYTYLHYKTSTEPGNSGSPLIDFVTCRVIGLHRAGPGRNQTQIPRLNNAAGGIEANEGVHIDSIRAEIARAAAEGNIAVPRLAASAIATVPAAAPAAAAPAAVVITVPQLAPIDGALVERITYAQLMERLSNPNSSKGDLAQYFLPDPEGSSAYAPGFKINPESVDMQGVREAVSDFLKPANYFCALRRRDACRQKIASGYDGLRLVSEGDSWFQYPFLLDDVIDNLSRDYAVYCIAAAGDVLQNMASPQNVDGEILPAIREINADGLLFSGGGNDIVGEILLKCLAEHNNAAEPLRYLTQEFDAQLAVIRKLYQSAFDAIFRRNPGLKIFTHGYDLPTPKPKGKWLGSYFEKRNIADTGLQRAIVKAMLGKVTDMHRHLAQLYDGRVFFVDCAGIVGDNAWYDELHPTNAGYTKVADRFRIAIGQAFPKRQGLRRIA